MLAFTLLFHSLKEFVAYTGAEIRTFTRSGDKYLFVIVSVCYC